MLGLFCSSKANNNEEYRKVIRIRMNRMILILIVGVITLVFALMAIYVWKITGKDQTLGVYMGLGSGLIFGAGCFLIKYNLILKNEEKLKIDRLNNTDERIQEISNKSYKIATMILLVGLYAVGLIGGIFYPVLQQVLLFLICLFLLGYMVSYKIYERRM